MGPRLRYGPGGWGEGGVEEEEEKNEKTPHMCESIGHQPFWGRSPLNFNHNLLKQGTVTI